MGLRQRATLLIVFWILGTVTAFAAPKLSLIPDHRFSRIGPENAKGAVIWLHGWCPGYEDCTQLFPPPSVTVFADRKWDLFRLIIPTGGRNHDRISYLKRARYFSELALKYAKELRAEGYKRIVLAGQSGGAMGVIYAGTRSDKIDAIVAMAPCCGTGKHRYISVSGVYNLLRKFKAPRLMIFFFADERHAPPEMAHESAKALDKTKTVYRIYDRPVGFEGHGGGLSYFFGKRFAPEIMAFSTSEDLESKIIRVRAYPGKSMEEIEEKIGEKGSAYIKELQQQMKAFKYYSGRVDGRYGPMSRRALIACVRDELCY